MTLDPILNAPVEIRLHLVFALVAIAVGPFALFRNKRDKLHKVLGYIWIAGMTGLAITGLFIRSDFPIVGRFGPIHALCILALWGMAQGVYFARNGEIKSHQATMKSVWYGAIGITGLLTLLPGRTLNRALFGAVSEAGLIVVAVGLVGLVWLYVSQRKRTIRRPV